MSNKTNPSRSHKCQSFRASSFSGQKSCVPVVSDCSALVPHHAVCFFYGQVSLHAYLTQALRLCLQTLFSVVVYPGVNLWYDCALASDLTRFLRNNARLTFNLQLLKFHFLSQKCPSLWVDQISDRHYSELTRACSLQLVLLLGWE